VVVSVQCRSMCLQLEVGVLATAKFMLEQWLQSLWARTCLTGPLYFAAPALERTYLSWMHMATVVGGVTTALSGFAIQVSPVHVDPALKATNLLSVVAPKSLPSPGVAQGRRSSQGGAGSLF
jgi:hypothetical protein